LNECGARVLLFESFAVQRRAVDVKGSKDGRLARSFLIRSQLKLWPLPTTIFNGATVFEYRKLAIVLLRTMGIAMLLYAGPMVLWGVVKATAGGTTASDGTTNLRSIIFAWGIYAVAGLLLLLLARPLAHVAAQGLDESSNAPSAA
jgi:hypothetical protein